MDRRNATVDTALVTKQLGRTPRNPWRVAARCRWQCPQVIVMPPVLDDGTLFPTLFWLTCPWLVTEVHRHESDGAIHAWNDRIASNPAIRVRLHHADEMYRGVRLEEGDGVDPCASVGVAGQADPLAVKCLHARTAAYLAGIGDPVGEDMIRAIGTGCSNGECSNGRNSGDDIRTEEPA